MLPMIFEFVYPWVKGEDQFEELRYSLRSLELHFKEPFRVIIVGDLPDWSQNVIHIPHTRETGMTENVLYDAITKMKLVCQSPEVNNYFIRMYDDIYLLQDMGFNEMSTIRALYNSKDMPPVDGSASQTWVSQRERTFKELAKRNQPVWNTETHLPEVYLKSILSYVLESFEAIERRLLISSLYNNVVLCHDEKPKIISKYTNDKAGFYGIDSEFSYCTNNLEQIKSILSRKLFLNHNDAGLNKYLEDTIKQIFPTKSKFEK